MSPRRILSVFLLALLAAVPAAQATTLVRMNVDQLTASAAVVARVRCLSNESRWDEGQIWTFTTFEVIETLKGDVPKQITVRLIGGKVGHLISHVAGVPRFEPGEQAILFLEPTRAGDLSVTSWAQGTFRIRRDPDTGRETVTQDISGLSTFDPATRQFLPGGVRNLPLEQFKEQVAAAIERQGSRR